MGSRRLISKIRIIFLATEATNGEAVRFFVLHGKSLICHIYCVDGVWVRYRHRWFRHYPRAFGTWFTSYVRTLNGVILVPGEVCKGIMHGMYTLVRYTDTTLVPVMCLTNLRKTILTGILNHPFCPKCICTSCWEMALTRCDFNVLDQAVLACAIRWKYASLFGTFGIRVPQYLFPCVASMAVHDVMHVTGWE